MEKERYIYVPIEYMRLKEHMEISYFDMLFYCYLLKIALENVKKKDANNLKLTFTQYKLACILNVQERQIYRTIKRLEKKNLISYHKLDHQIELFIYENEKRKETQKVIKELKEKWKK